MATTTDFELLSTPYDSKSTGDPVPLRFAVGKNGERTIKYVTVHYDVYPESWHIQYPVTVAFPAFPSGHWNMARLRKDERTGKPAFAHVERRELPGIDRDDLWHGTRIDYFELTQLEGDIKGGGIVQDKLKLFTYPAFGERKMVMKIAAIPDKRRVIGILIEYIAGAREARKGDIVKCRESLSNLHEKTGLLHQDTHGGNFLVKGDKVYVIDFEFARPNIGGTREENAMLFEADM